MKKYEEKITQQYYTAHQLLLNYCKKIKDDNLMYYQNICNLGIFCDDRIPVALLNTNDQSYQYYIDILKKHPKAKVLFNVFSGSGKFIHELEKNKLINHYSHIYNLDQSPVMINFEKKMFSNERLIYICENILNFDSKDINYDIAVCHCGIRYIHYKNYEKLIDVMWNAKKGINSKCVISESNEKLITSFIKILRKKNIFYTINKKKINVHKNTTFYISLLYFDTDNQFRSIIDHISKVEHTDYITILEKISGYKKCFMYFVEF